MGAIVDKHEKKKLMILSRISSIIVIMLFEFLWELAKQFVAIGVMFGLINDINNEIFARSYISMTADLFTEKEYIKFQSISNIVIRIISVAGVSVTGVLIDFISNHLIFGIELITYLISLFFISKVVYDEKSRLEERRIQKKNSILRSIISDIQYTFHSLFEIGYLIVAFNKNINKIVL